MSGFLELIWAESLLNQTLKVNLLDMITQILMDYPMTTKIVADAGNDELYFEALVDLRWTLDNY